MCAARAERHRDDYAPCDEAWRQGLSRLLTKPARSDDRCALQRASTTWSHGIDAARLGRGERFARLEGVHDQDSARADGEAGFGPGVAGARGETGSRAGVGSAREGVDELIQCCARRVRTL